MHNESLGVGVLYPLAFAPTAFAAYHIRRILCEQKHKEVLDKDFFMRIGVVHGTLVLCMGYLYGFTVAPFTSEISWWSLALFYPAIALLPIPLIYWTASKRNWTEEHQACSS